jgi:peptidyl-prolyl cis-trans isomerase D
VVKTDFGYHYIEVLGQKDFKPAYKVAYLAKPLVASNETISEASTAAAQFTVSSKNAKQFNENALKQNKVVFPVSDLKANDNSINTLGENRQLVRWAFEKSVGDVSEPVEIGDKYVVALLTAVNKPGLMSATEARPQVEGMVRNEKKAKLIIDTKIKGNSLEEISASTKSPVLHADSLVFAAAFIAGVGSEPKVVGAAFNKSLVGKVSSPIAGVTGVFSVKALSQGARPSGILPDAVKQGLLQTRRMGTYRSLEALRNGATIVDNRAKYY